MDERRQALTGRFNPELPVEDCCAGDCTGELRSGGGDRAFIGLAGLCEEAVDTFGADAEARALRIGL
jgi:hypothetical protein